jgi:SSS family solute:Na+ symporter
MHRWALLAGWAAGMTTGTLMARELHFKGNVYPLQLGGWTILGYTALWALLVNLAIACAGSAALRWFGVDPGHDATRPEDYGGA